MFTIMKLFMLIIVFMLIILNKNYCFSCLKGSICTTENIEDQIKTSGNWQYYIWNNYGI